MQIIDTGQRLLMDLSPKEEAQIKEALTFDNPEYAKVKRFSKWGTASTVDPYIRFYKEFDDAIIVPRGYTPPFKPTKVTDSRVTVRALYPPFKYELRGAQKNAYEAFKKSSKSGLFVLPTGAGKTILGLFLAGTLKQKVLVVVQKNDLVAGWTKDAYETYGIRKEQLGLIKAKSRKIGRLITLCTIQTLNNMSPTEIYELSSKFGMVILDECHHVIAQSYKILSNMRSRYTLGFTATDTRGDGLGKAIPLLFGELIYRAKEEDVKDSILPVTVYVKETRVVYKGAVRYRMKGKIYTEKEAKSLLAQGYEPERVGIDSHERDAVIDTNLPFNQQIVSDVILEAKKGRSCVVFCKKRYQLDILHKLLNSNFDPSRVAQYVGGSKNDAEFIARAESKEILITLTTLKKATEGTNVKAWECGFLASSLKSTGDVIQAVGRVRRRTDYHKEATIFDYRHPHVYGMQTHEKGRDKAYKSIGATVKRLRSTPKLSRGFL